MSTMLQSLLKLFVVLGLLSFGGTTEISDALPSLENVISLEETTRSLDTVDVLNALVEDFVLELPLDVGEVDAVIVTLTFPEPIVCDSFSVRQLLFNTASQAPETIDGINYEKERVVLSVDDIAGTCVLPLVSTDNFFGGVNNGLATITSSSTDITIDFDVLSTRFGEIIPTLGLYDETIPCEDILDLSFTIDVSGLLISDIADFIIPIFEGQIEDAVCTALRGIFTNFTDLLTENPLAAIAGERATLDDDFNQTIEITEASIASEMPGFQNWNETEALLVLKTLTEELLKAPALIGVTTKGLEFVLVAAGGDRDATTKALEGFLELFIGNASLVEELAGSVVDDGVVIELVQVAIGVLTNDTSVEELIAAIFEAINLDIPSIDFEEVISTLPDFAIELLNSTGLLEIIESVLELFPEGETGETGGAGVERQDEENDESGIDLGGLLNLTIGDLIDLFPEPNPLTELLQSFGNETLVADVIGLLGAAVTEVGDILGGGLDLSSSLVLDEALFPVLTVLSSLVPELEPVVAEILSTGGTLAPLFQFLSLSFPVDGIGNLTGTLERIQLNATLDLDTAEAGLAGDSSVLFPGVNLSELVFVLGFRTEAVNEGEQLFSDVLQLSVRASFFYQAALTGAFQFSSLQGFGWSKLDTFEALPGMLIDYFTCASASLALAVAGQQAEASFTSEFNSLEGALTGLVEDFAAAFLEYYSPLVPTLAINTLHNVTAPFASGSFFVLGGENATCADHPVVETPEDEITPLSGDVFSIPLDLGSFDFGFGSVSFTDSIQCGSLSLESLAATRGPETSETFEGSIQEKASFTIALQDFIGSCHVPFLYEDKLFGENESVVFALDVASLDIFLPFLMYSQDFETVIPSFVSFEGESGCAEILQLVLDASSSEFLLSSLLTEVVTSLGSNLGSLFCSQLTDALDDIADILSTSPILKLADQRSPQDVDLVAAVTNMESVYEEQLDEEFVFFHDPAAAALVDILLGNLAQTPFVSSLLDELNGLIVAFQSDEREVIQEAISNFTAFFGDVELELPALILDAFISSGTFQRIGILIEETLAGNVSILAFAPSFLTALGIPPEDFLIQDVLVLFLDDDILEFLVASGIIDLLQSIWNDFLVPAAGLRLTTEVDGGFLELSIDLEASKFIAELSELIKQSISEHHRSLQDTSEIDILELIGVVFNALSFINEEPAITLSATDRLPEPLLDVVAILPLILPELEEIIDDLVFFNGTLSEVFQLLAFTFAIDSIGEFNLALESLTFGYGIDLITDNVGFAGDSSLIIPGLNISELLFSIAFGVQFAREEDLLLNDTITLGVDLQGTLQQAFTFALNPSTIEKFDFADFIDLSSITTVLINLATCMTSSLAVGAAGSAAALDFSVLTESQSDFFGDFIDDFVAQLTALYSPFVPTLLENSISLVFDPETMTGLTTLGVLPEACDSSVIVDTPTASPTDDGGVGAPVGGDDDNEDDDPNVGDQAATSSTSLLLPIIIVVAVVMLSLLMIIFFVRRKKKTTEATEVANPEDTPVDEQAKNEPTDVEQPEGKVSV